MILASFYAPRPVPQHRYDFIACLRVQHRSCQRYGVRQLVITDAPGLADLATFHAALPQPLMPAILAGQLAFLEAAPPDEDLLLVGADCLLGRDPHGLFDGGFDLAVTTHPFEDCILNTGLIAVAAGKAPLAAAFWRRAYARCGVKWGDDQTALAEALDATLTHGDALRGDARVRFLPVPGFNDAPDNVAQNLDALIVHFRGPRKAWMAAWALRHAGL